MDKKYKKEIDKEVKDIHKTTLMVNNRMQKIFGLKEENEEESDEENEEIEDYLNDVNDEEVSSILLKAEQEMKEEEEEKKREKKENEENDEKMERDLKEELERISDDEKEKKKKKKKKEKKKKKKEDKDEEEEEDSYDDFEEYKRWKKMRKMQREKKKEENNKKKEIKESNKSKEKKSDEEKEEINNKENNKKQEKIIKNIDNNINYKTEVKGGNKHNDKQDDKHNAKNEDKNNDKNDNKEEKDMEFDYNINNINNNNLNKEGDNNLNNNNDDDNNLNNNNNFDNNNNINDDVNNNNNNAQPNNKQGPIIPKNVYDQVSSTDKKVITDLLRAGNAKYQEGEIFSSTGKYSEALKCYYQAKNLFLGINKLVQTKKNAYPKEFRMIITSKINDKLKLVHQSAKNCSSSFKDKRIGQLINKNTMINNPNNNNIGNTMNNNINNTVNNNISNTVNNNIGNTMNNNINKTVNNNINNTMNNNLNNKNSDDINNILSKNQNTNNNINNNNKDMNNYNFDFNALNNDKNNNANNNKNIKLGNTNKPQNNPNKPKSLHDKEEDAMDQKILSEIMTKNPGVKFSDIIGMNDMKQTLYEIIVVPTIRPDLFTGIRTPQRGILLFGPPGTGKTMIAKAIASECGSTFFNISASSLTSKWVGESEKTVKSLFKIAYQKVPSIIFIDEIDSILSKRSESENEATKRLKTEFLIQFDGLGSNTSARLLVIAATNRPMDLDEALLRRLPKRVYCGPLDEDGRFEFIKKVINRVETDLSDDDIREIAKMTNDYSNSDLMELCREAAYKPVRELTNEEIMKLDKFRPINKKDLVDAAHKIRGTLSKKVKDELRKWNEQFGGV